MGKNLPVIQETRFDPWVGKIRLRRGRLGFDPWIRKIPWRRKLKPTPVFLPRESHGQSILAGYSHKEPDMTERLSTSMFCWNLQFYNQGRSSSSIWSNCTFNFLTWWTAQTSHKHITETKAILFCQRIWEWIDFFFNCELIDIMT